LEIAADGRDVVLAEGAGGLLVPVTSQMMMIDVAARLGLALLVVARDALGTVNHTLLTLEAIRSRDLPLLGVIISCTVPSPTELENRRAIEVHGRVPVLGSLPYLPEADDATLASIAEEHLDLDTILVRCSGLALGAKRR
jgi:dethiobiotin synthetase